MCLLVGLAALGAADHAAAKDAKPAGGEVVVRPGHQAEDIARLLDLARERGQDIVIRIEPAAGAAATPAPANQHARLEGSLLDGWHGSVDLFVSGLIAGIDGVRALPRALDTFAARWRTDSATTPAPLMRIAAMVAGALLLGWLAQRGVRALVARAPAPPSTLAGRLSNTSRGTLADLAGVVAFAIGLHFLRSQLLGDDGLVVASARDLNHALVAFGLYWLGARFLLSTPDHAARLLPIQRPAWHYRMVLLYALIATFIQATVITLAETADTEAVTGWILIVTTFALAFKLVWFWSAREDVAALVRARGGDSPGLPTRMAAALVVWALIAVAVANWVLGRFAAVLAEGISWGIAAGVTQVAVVVLPILATGAERLTAEVLGARSAAIAPLRQATIAIARAAAFGGVWVIGLIGLGRVWGIAPMAAQSGPGQAMWRVVLTIGVALAIGWALWRFASVYLAAHAPKPTSVLPSGDDDEEEPAAQSRLATALPLVRSVILGAVIGVTALIVLSSLGLDIGPLLAGFGVIGLALSFGSQALVRDIVSGIFFMADDAFRVGEYIDTGRLKGTVEKITIRSVQLRHQSGLVHTIPFGQIQQITNASRDWATVKFNIRLERGVDLEKTRKTIKKVGQSMLEEPELAAEIMLPLKMQGVADIADTAIVCRLKITAKPARASWVQREALKRVYRALEEAGIAFASGAVTVRGAVDGDAGAAAQTAGAGAVVALRSPS